MEKSLDGIVLANNYVAVSGLGYGTDYDQSYNEQYRLDLWVRVEAIGEIGRVDAMYAEYYEVDNKVEVGDEVLLRWYDAIDAIDSERIIEDNGVFYYLVDYSGIVAIRRGDEIIPVNDMVLYEGKDVIGMEDNITSLSPSGRVYAVSNDIKYYKSYPDSNMAGETFKSFDIDVGDYIYVWARQGLEIEHSFLQRLGKKLYAVQKKDIWLKANKPISVVANFTYDFIDELTPKFI